MVITYYRKQKWHNFLLGVNYAEDKRKAGRQGNYPSLSKPNKHKHSHKIGEHYYIFIICVPTQMRVVYSYSKGY